MKSFTSFLRETPEIFALADIADEVLSQKDDRMVSSFIGGHKDDLRGMGFGVFNTKRLEHAYRDNTEEYQELQKLFEPVKQKIEETHGSKVRLYRSERSRHVDEERYLLSYSSSPSFVFYHATGYPATIQFPNQEEVKKKERELKEKGQVTIKWPGNNKATLKMSDEYPGTIDIWESGEYITDADSDVIQNYFDDAMEVKDTIVRRMRLILVHDVLIDDIIWVTDRAKQAEFIVANKPRTNLAADQFPIKL